MEDSFVFHAIVRIIFPKAIEFSFLFALQERIGELLLLQAEADEELGMRLKMHVSKESKNVNLALYHSAIDQALKVEKFDWVITLTSVRQNGQGHQITSRSSERWLCRWSDRPRGVCLKNWISALRIDDSNGELGCIMDEVYDLHYETCLKAKPAPEEFARRLYSIETKSSFDVFYNTAERTPACWESAVWRCIESLRKRLGRSCGHSDEQPRG